MATYTVTATGGTRNWNDPATFTPTPLNINGPQAADDIIVPVGAGNLTVNLNSSCLNITFQTGYLNTFTISNGITLSVTGNTITLGSGMTYNQTTTGILSMLNSQASVAIALAGKTIPYLTIGKSTAGPQTITISGPTPTIKNLLVGGVVTATLAGIALNITTSIVVNQRLDGVTPTFLGSVTLSGTGILNTGFTVPASSTLTIGSNISVGGNITFALGSSLIPSTWVVTMAFATTLDSVAVIWYNILIFNANGVIVTLTSNWNISNNFYWSVPSGTSQITSTTSKTVSIQGNAGSTTTYAGTLLLTNITLNLTGQGTFAASFIVGNVLNPSFIRIDTTNPTGYQIGSAAISSANFMRLSVGITLTLVGTSAASAFSSTTISLNGATLNTNRSADTVGGDNIIYGAIYIEAGGGTFSTDTTCLGNLTFFTTVSGVSVNGSKILFGGDLIGSTAVAPASIFTVQGTSTLEFTGNNPATWRIGSYRNNINVNKTGGATVTAASGLITWGFANAVLNLNTIVNFSANSNTFTLSGTPLAITNSSNSSFFNLNILTGVTLNIN
jgi:hypothetical protein